MCNICPPVHQLFHSKSRFKCVSWFVNVWQWNYSLIKLYDRPFVGCPALRWLTSLLREFERGNNFILYSGRDWEKSANFKELSHSLPACCVATGVACGGCSPGFFLHSCFLLIVTVLFCTIFILIHISKMLQIMLNAGQHNLGPKQRWSIFSSSVCQDLKWQRTTDLVIYSDWIPCSINDQSMLLERVGKLSNLAWKFDHPWSKFKLLSFSIS